MHQLPLFPVALFTLFSFLSLRCVNAPQSDPVTAGDIAGLAKAPNPEYDPTFEFDYKMIAVHGGVFTMGCTNKKKSHDSDECPHLDTVQTFKMGIYEVSKYQWMQVMGDNPGAFSDCFDCPAHYVSWFDVQRFIKKLNKVTGRKYRLPTEAEWEFAAKGGAQGAGANLLYAGSNKLEQVAWYNANSEKRLHPVGLKEPNALGIYDLSGNVREWCEDMYEGYPDCPIPHQMSLTRCCRGGSWISTWFGCRLSERMGVEPSGRYLNMGFRLAHD